MKNFRLNINCHCILRKSNATFCNCYCKRKTHLSFGLLVLARAFCLWRLLCSFIRYVRSLVPPISVLYGGLWMCINQFRFRYFDVLSRHNSAAPLIGLIEHQLWLTAWLPLSAIVSCRLSCCVTEAAGCRERPNTGHQRCHRSALSSGEHANRSRLPEDICGAPVHRCE